MRYKWHLPLRREYIWLDKIYKGCVFLSYVYINCSTSPITRWCVLQRIPALKQYVLGCGRTTSNILMKLGGMIQYGRADLNLAVYVKYIGIQLGFGHLIVRKSENNYPAREIKYASRWASLLTGLWCVFFPVKSSPHPPRPSCAHSPAGNALFSPRARMRTMKRFVLYSLRKYLNNCDIYRLVWRTRRRTWRKNGRVLSILLQIQCQSFVCQLYASMNIWGTRSLEPPKQTPDKKEKKKSMRCFWN